jgi:hypothetical protein
MTAGTSPSALPWQGQAASERALKADDHRYDVAEILGDLYGDGITGLRAAFPVGFVDQLRTDVDGLFAEALATERGAMPRGPQRYYVEVQPERLSGFVDIVSHPWVTTVCNAVLGRDYRFVEVGFDVPLPGAADQPWHRDFAASPNEAHGARLSSLVLNMTLVDTRPEHGPFEIAPGTQWDDLTGSKAGMFPPRELWPRYIERAERKLPKRGDISARTGLTIHRGTANRSNESRPVLILGVVAADCTDAERHILQMTPGFAETLPGEVREHLFFRPIERTGPIVQHHMIEGLLEAAYG